VAQHADRACLDPVSLLSTLALMTVLHYNLNLLTMVALV